MTRMGLFRLSRDQPARKYGITFSLVVSSRRLNLSSLMRKFGFRTRSGRPETAFPCQRTG